MACQIFPHQLRARWQAPIAAPRYKVHYLKNGREHTSPWLHSSDKADKALMLMQKKYGVRNCIFVVD
jgi:hypothetical protein